MNGNFRFINFEKKTVLCCQDISVEKSQNPWKWKSSQEIWSWKLNIQKWNYFAWSLGVFVWIFHYTVPLEGKIWSFIYNSSKFLQQTISYPYRFSTGEDRPLPAEHIELNWMCHFLGEVDAAVKFHWAILVGK